MTRHKPPVDLDVAGVVEEERGGDERDVEVLRVEGHLGDVHKHNAGHPRHKSLAVQQL